MGFPFLFSLLNSHTTEACRNPNPPSNEGGTGSSRGTNQDRSFRTRGRGRRGRGRGRGRSQSKEGSVNIVQAEETQDTMSVYMDRGHTSRLSGTVSPSDRDYSSLEEENFDNDVDIYSFSLEEVSDRYSGDMDDDDFGIHKKVNETTSTQTISYISEIKLVFNYPQPDPPLTTQPSPQAISTFSKIIVPTPSIDISLRSEMEVYCFDTHMDYNRRKLTRSPGEKNYSHKLSNRIKKSKWTKRKQTRVPLIYSVSIKDLGRSHDKPYINLQFTKNNPNTGQSQNPIFITSLCDTGACKSVISQALTRQLGLHVDNSSDIYIRTANNSRVKCDGKTWIWSKHPLSNRWVPIECIVVKSAKVLIISNNDLKRLRLLEDSFPYFLGDVQKNIPVSDERKSDEESVYAVRSVNTKSQDAVYTTPEIHRQVSQDTQSNTGNTQYGPRIEQILSKTIEVDINEEDPDSAEAEVAH